MATVLTVRFATGDITEQLFQLKVSALANHDIPSMWRLTESLVEMLVAMSGREEGERWPAGYVRPERLFGVPVDFVAQMPHLLCENYVVYPYVVSPPHILLAH